MKLLRVQIKNFRSISELTLELDPPCQCLIGINESGKSNILRALHLLDTTATPAVGDLRIERHDEPQVTSGYVRFLFELDKFEIQEIYEEVEAQLAAESIDKPLFSDGTEEYSLWDYCNLSGHHPVCQGIFEITLPGGRKYSTTWSRDKHAVLSHWYRSKLSSSLDLPLETGTVKVPARGYVSVPHGLSSETFDPADYKELSDLISGAVRKVVDRELPECIFWRYADKYLLPSSVDVAQFCQNPETCVPLKSMFELAGYPAKDLSATISAAQAQGHHRYVQILEKTAVKATEHIRSVWSDYKSVRLKLESHGSALFPIVTDDVVPLDMSNRSDGFKRFVSFLLQISARVRTKELRNALILIDEPESGLHPSGAKSLLAQLIAIGESNTVVFSTHSIFMIDKSNIGRHLVVEKKKEVTSTWRAERSRIQDEEVLYSAIGYSIFEALKEKNVIFEGWRDKKIFEVAAAAVSKSDGKVKAALAAIGLTFADGVKDVRNVAHVLQLASRPCLIVSDADKVALQHRKAYLAPGSWGEWLTLQDVLPGSSALTGEDLITRAATVKRANRFRGSVEGLAPLAEAFFHSGESTADALKRWLGSAGLEGNELEDALSGLKGALFEDLKRSELSDLAEQLVRFVADYDFHT